MQIHLKILKPFFLFLIITMLFHLGCSPKYGEIVKGKYWEGLIVKTERIPHRKGDTPTWTASRELVLAIEPELIEYIKKSGKERNADQWILDHLSEYKLQYLGFFENNSKVLAISFSHISQVKDGAWKEPFGVLGGGHYFFHVKYDIQKKTFKGLSINADA